MFGEPLFLIAAAIGAFIPLILHLLQKSRTVYEPFPTLRFLKLASKRSSQKIRLENLLLWLLRTAILVLLGLAFANPILRASSLGFLGRAARDVAIVLDASYSMMYQTGRKAIWDSAVETATEVINSLDPNDRYCLYIALESPVALIAEPVGDRERGLSQLRETEPYCETSRLAAALAAAHKALAQVPQRRERELHIITDNQSLPWDDFRENPTAETIEEQEGDSPSAGPPAQWDASAIDKRTAVFVTLLGAPTPMNAAPVDIELMPASLFSGSPARLAVQIGCSGDISETTVSFFINNREIARRAVQTAGERISRDSFAIPPQPVGVHIARLETPPDNLPVDNVFHFLLRVRDQLPTLCVGSEEDTVFLRAALKAGASGTAASWTTPDRLLEEKALGVYSCVFLANALPLSGQAIAEIERYVANGGVLVLFPGSRGTPDDYRAWDCLPGAPVEIRAFIGRDRNRTLTWDQPNHSLLEPMRESLAVPQLSIERSLGWDKTHPQAAQLVSAGPAQPFLLQRDYGRGSVLMFGVSADRSWSTFPLSPFYLPMVMQIVEYSAEVGNEPPFIWCDDAARLDSAMSDVNAETTLLDPEGRPISVRAIVQSSNLVSHVASLKRPGIYSLGGTESDSPSLAVNFRREESDLAPIEPDSITELIGARNVRVCTDIDSLRSAIQEHRIGRTYSEHLLVLALLLAGIEFVYANALARSKPDLSSRLGVTSSGSFGGHKQKTGKEPA